MVLARKLEAAASQGRTFELDLSFQPHLWSLIENADDLRQLFEHLRWAKLCLDVAHLHAAGSNPLEIIQSTEFGSIIAHVHIKDWDGNNFVELGQGDGSLDIPAVLMALEATGYPGFVGVELDSTTTTPLESATRNREYLRRLGY